MRSSGLLAPIVLVVGLLVGGVVMLNIDPVQRGAGGERAGSSQGAAVLVAFKPDDTTLESCGSQGESSCVEQAIANMAFREGPEQALARLEQLAGENEQIQVACHSMTHEVGAAALLHFDGSVAKALAGGSGACGAGYYHGLMATALGGVDREQLGEKASTLCPSSLPVYVHGQCLHGLGHGVMAYVGYDVDAAVEVCDRLQDADRQSCGTGVMMENFSPSFRADSPGRDAARPAWPCNEVDTTYRQPCYAMAGTWILTSTNMDLPASGAVCAKVEEAFRATCYESLGGYLTGMLAFRVPAVADGCVQVGGAVAANDCVLGAAGAFANDGSTTETAERFCRTVVVASRPSCYEGLARSASVRLPDVEARRSLCERTAPGFVDACLRGAGVGGEPEAA